MLLWKGYLIKLINELLNKLTDCGWKWLLPPGSITNQPIGKQKGKLKVINWLQCHSEQVNSHRPKCKLTLEMRIGEKQNSQDESYQTTTENNWETSRGSIKENEDMLPKEYIFSPIWFDNSPCLCSSSPFYFHLIEILTY